MRLLPGHARVRVNPEKADECFDADGLFIGHESADKVLAAGDRKRARLILLLSQVMLESRVRIVSKHAGHPAQAEVLGYLAECRGEVLRRLESL